MGATTFMEYSKERAAKAALKAKQAEDEAKKAKTAKKRAAAKKEAAKQKAAAKHLTEESNKFNPRPDAKHVKPEEVTDKAVHFQKPTAIDLDGDGQADVIVTPIKK
jgi:septal ring factor EnvC (AmiA/AmiB activator)